MDPGELGNGPSGDRNVEAEFSDNVYATGYNDAGYDEYVAVGESGYEGYPTEVWPHYYNKQAQIHKS